MYRNECKKLDIYILCMAGVFSSFLPLILFLLSKVTVYSWYVRNTSSEFFSWQDEFHPGMKFHLIYM